MAANVINPYKANEKKYLSQLAPLFKSAQRTLPRHCKNYDPKEVISKIKIDFGNVLENLPYIGRKEHPFLFSYIASAAGLASIRVLERENLPVETIGEFLYDTYKDVYQSLPEVVKRYLRWKEFALSTRQKIIDYAIISQTRKFPDDWVFTYIKGDGKNFNYGVDYAECAVLKLYKKMGAEKFMPYVCAGDFASSGVLRTGLHRTKTIYFGGQCCDFRYTKNANALRGLPFEDLPEYVNRI